MPTIYLKKELYIQIVKNGDEPGTFVNQIVEKELKKEAKK